MTNAKVNAYGALGSAGLVVFGATAAWGLPGLIFSFGLAMMIGFLLDHVIAESSVGPVELKSGELYWLRGVPGGRCFVAEYQANNNDRDGRPAGAAFWQGVAEVPGTPEVVAHIPRPT